MAEDWAESEGSEVRWMPEGQGQWTWMPEGQWTAKADGCQMGANMTARGATVETCAKMATDTLYVCALSLLVALCS